MVDVNDPVKAHVAAYAKLAMLFGFPLVAGAGGGREGRAGSGRSGAGAGANNLARGGRNFGIVVAMKAARIVMGTSLGLLVASLAACGDSPPPRSAQTEMVPSNSAFEASKAKPQIVGEPPSSDTSRNEAGGNTPSSGAPTPLAGSGGPTSSGVPTPAAGGGPAATPPAADSGKKPSKAECQAVMDHYLDLEINSRPELKSLPQDMVKSMIAQAKQQASSQKGDPCTEEGVTRAKYACGMKATTPEAWKVCMK